VYEDLEGDDHGLIDGSDPENLSGYTEGSTKNFEWLVASPGFKSHIYETHM
jgi:hypothetical protein